MLEVWGRLFGCRHSAQMRLNAVYMGNVQNDIFLVFS